METTVQGKENLQSGAASADSDGSAPTRYRGRFAPSPTGPLHRGSLVAALASWLDARTHEGNWLIRIENIDAPRERSGAAAEQIAQLQRYGMISDEPIWLQSERSAAYESALQKLHSTHSTYYCRCTRAMRVNVQEDPTYRAYPGTCRGRGYAPPGAVRLRVDTGPVDFTDRACGRFVQDVAQEVGDFVLRRSDGLWAYQLAVVVDDAAQGITDVVRGADLLDNTPRQMLLQRALGLPTPRYLHVPLVRDPGGQEAVQAGAGPAAGQPRRAGRTRAGLAAPGFCPQRRRHGAPLPAGGHRAVERAFLPGSSRRSAGQRRPIGGAVGGRAGVDLSIALLTDIHANREALTACLAHAEEHGATQFVFLGDYVGYGADPAWVVDTIRQLRRAARRRRPARQPRRGRGRVRAGALERRRAQDHRLVARPAVGRPAGLPARAAADRHRRQLPVRARQRLGSARLRVRVRRGPGDAQHAWWCGRASPSAATCTSRCSTTWA